nr:OpgC domain-containing protein [Edaphobacter lichenicola]
MIRQNRDLRVDFFRGFALWCMLIDHFINGWLRAITLKEYGFCDAAELFVLLSGISAGIVYHRTVVRDGLRPAWLKIARRIVAIYRTHLIMFMLFAAEVSILVAWLNPPSFLEFLALDGFRAHPFRSIMNVALLGTEPKFFDILPLYIVLLVILALTLPLIRWPRSLLVGSILLYVAARVFHLNLGSWTENWFFNPLAWQVIFMLGVTSPYILKAKNYWRGWDWLAALFSLFSLFESHTRHLDNHLPAALLIHFDVDKPTVHPFRLLAIVSLGWLAWRYIPAAADWLRSRWAEPFVLLGQHSLGVFSSSVLFAVLGEAILFTHPGWISQILVQGLGTLALVAVAALSAWNSNKSRIDGRATNISINSNDLSPMQGSQRRARMAYTVDSLQ